MPACGCRAPTKMGVDSLSETARSQMKCFLLQVVSGMVSLHSNGKVTQILRELGELRLLPVPQLSDAFNKGNALHVPTR